MLSETKERTNTFGERNEVGYDRETFGISAFEQSRRANAVRVARSVSEHDDIHHLDGVGRDCTVEKRKNTVTVSQLSQLVSEQKAEAGPVRKITLWRLILGWIAFVFMTSFITALPPVVGALVGLITMVIGITKVKRQRKMLGLPIAIMGFIWLAVAVG